MKILLTSFCACLLLFACDNASEATKEKDSTSQSDDPKDEKPVVYTAQAVLEGYDSDPYVVPFGSWNGEEAEVPEYTELHVVPFSVQKDGICDEMIKLYSSDFQLYKPFDEHSGKVVCFYDKEKRHIATEYHVKNGKPDGNVKLYTPKGRLFMEREYSEGEWVKTRKAPACSDWIFNQSKSNIEIRDLTNGESRINGQRVINLMASVDKQNSNFQSILDKSTYVRPLKINGQPFTGRLNGHFTAPFSDTNLNFTLDFTKGLLDGEVKIFNDLGMLELHEIFVKGDLEETVHVIDWSEMDGVAKPIIYLYPETTTEVAVALNFKGKLTHTYPRYQEGWNVTAHPDGTLFDADGKEYYALYWEGDNSEPFTLNEGTVVKGENTIEFLESSLETLGLNRREANEFIMYWLPRMENNAYNLIHFSSKEYEEMAELKISPKPETMIRVMMVFQPLKKEIKVPSQDLEQLRKERKGFTVVEWGGKEVGSREI